MTMTSEQAEQIAALQAQLDAAVRGVEASGARVLALGEHAARTERRAPDRRAIERAVRRVRIALTTSRHDRPRVTSWPVPVGDDHNGRDGAMTQPLRPGAP